MVRHRIREKDICHLTGPQALDYISRYLFKSCHMTFADKLSVLRIILIPVFLLLLSYSRAYDILRYWAIAVFFLAVLTDFFDGLVARIKNEKSAIGTVIDPVADKLLMISAFIALYTLGFHIPLWVVVISVSRDIILLIGFAMLSFLRVEISISPTFLGKTTTTLQMATVMAVLFHWRYSPYLWTISALCTFISGIGYITRGVNAVGSAAGEKAHR